MKEEVAAKAHDTKEAADEKAHGFTERVGETLEHAKDKIVEVAHDVGQWIKGKVTDTREKAADAVEPSAEDKTKAEMAKVEQEVTK